MTLAPLLAAPTIMQVHVLSALISLAAGLTVLVLRKGTARHRLIGWVFVVAMALTAASSAFITSNGRYSAIHLLSVLTIVNLPYAIIMRRRGNIVAHRSAMLWLFAGLVVAGAFTLVPGRLMNKLAFGDTTAPIR
ncbi:MULTISPECIES: DUF2306 domain-containing protein [unclassified Bosea (in: a-proteobacteria)]|nr:MULTISPECIES: DUF2306 domain-containing protein [unclassified Bosea (in: a-proteobacteria)]AZO81483.1 hypothetical protein BLM15_16540 [Bosea sp. Tri-49]RXT27740.1 hypothetical protein B5U98_01810 [Bosea sp. Tri-39]RXT36077.1 hypothetical protein B5U99_16190 [Bosea sp. Tri-54]